MVDATKQDTMTIAPTWDDDAWAPAQVALVVVCPHCDARFGLRSGHDVDVARAHVLAHLAGAQSSM